MLVVNSSSKILIYLCLSCEFRFAIKKLLRCKGSGDQNWHWMAEEQMNKEFLGHVKVATFIQANVCDTGEREQMLDS